MTLPRVAHWIGVLFAAELLLVLLWGGIAAWRFADDSLHIFAVLGAVSWLLLARATIAAPASGWAAWKGTLQFVTCWLLFPLFKAIRQVFIVHTADAVLLELDRALWGGSSLPEHLFAWARPWLSEVLSAGYFLFYFIILLPAIAFSLRRHTREARAFFLGLALMYLVGLAGYMLVPAAGPYLAFPAHFAYPPAGGPMTALLVAVVKDGITGMDAFPSLHSGIGVYVLGFFALGGYRRIAVLLAPAVLALVIATVYLRYHYGIDVLCGLALAAAVLTFIQRYRKDPST